MNRKSVTIWICAGIFCLSLFVALSPMVGNDGFFDYGFSAKRIALLVLGWCLIITVCGFLVRSKGKRKHRFF
jgi:hypothetical protein